MTNKLLKNGMVVAPSVTNKQAKDVERKVRRCIRHLRKKEYELNLPAHAADTAVRCLKVYRREGGTSRAGAGTIKINLGGWYFGNKFHPEYKAFQDHPQIGKIDVNGDDDLHLWVTVAHEIVHHVQYRYCHKVKRYKETYKKPHGVCFQKVYEYLRRDLINPMIKEHLSENA